MKNLSDVGTIFFLTVAASWAVLVPAKLWAYHKGDSWRRRLVMMFLGVWSALGRCGSTAGCRRCRVSRGRGRLAGVLVLRPRCLPAGTGLAEGAAYVIYFAVTFFGPALVAMADPRRSARFSFLPLLAGRFWGVLPLLIWQQPWRGAGGAW